MHQPKPLPKWARVLIQSLLVAGFMLLAFTLVHAVHSKLAVASLAASSFIAFGFPTAHSAKTRFLLGGYACGITGGLLGWAGLHLLMPEPARGTMEACIAFCVVAVFLTALAMFSLGLQHPPAAALAVGMVVEPSPLWMALSAAACILLLCGIRWLVLRFLGRFFEEPS